MDNNLFIQCPYEKTHSIQRKDIYNHIYFKCKFAKQSSKKYKFCQYDNSIFYEMQNEDIHRENCHNCKKSDKKFLDQSVINKKAKPEINLFSENSKLDDLQNESLINESVKDISYSIDLKTNIF